MSSNSTFLTNVSYNPCLFSILQLPYWIDGTIKMSESGAIMRYLARKNGLDGRTEEEKIRIDVAEGVIFDLTIKLGEVAYDPEAVGHYYIS